VAYKHSDTILKLSLYIAQALSTTIPHITLDRYFPLGSRTKKFDPRPHKQPLIAVLGRKNTENSHGTSSIH
jgi:hypothetical protein